MRYRLLLAGVTLVCCLVPAASARGDGLPVLGIGGATNGVRSLDGAYRYVAAPQARTTTVKAIATRCVDRGPAGTLRRAGRGL